MRSSNLPLAPASLDRARTSVRRNAPPSVRACRASQNTLGISLDPFCQGVRRVRTRRAFPAKMREYSP